MLMLKHTKKFQQVERKTKMALNDLIIQEYKKI